jgi:hypothetical protein
VVGRLIVGALGAIVLAGAALALGFRSYQAYLEWLVAGQGGPSADPAPAGAKDD